MRSTYTVAILEVSEGTFQEVAGKLRRAEYHHAFSGATIDMTGVGLQKKALTLPNSEEIGNGEYAGTKEAMEAAIKAAQAEGLEIIYGEPHTLLVDLDDGRLLNEDMLEKSKELFGPYTLESWPSKSGEGSHVLVTFTGNDVATHSDLECVVDLKPRPIFSAAAAMVLETALGSDPLRAVLGVRRLLHGVEQPRMLFRKPEDMRIVSAKEKAGEDTTDDDLPF